MKYLIYFLIVAACFTAKAESQKTEYLNINKDTLFFNWEITKYEIGSKVLPFRSKTLNKETMWITGLISPNIGFYSADDLKSWHIINNPPTEVRDYSLLSNNRVILIGDSMGLSSKSLQGEILESNDLSGDWTKRRLDIFKNTSLCNLLFKNDTDGFLNTFSYFLKRYEFFTTYDGGATWNLISNFDDIFKDDDTISIQRLEYMKESDAIISMVYSIKDKASYLLISKDFGENWTPARPFPIKNYNADYSSLFGFYMRNDSLWITAGSGNGHGLYEAVRYIALTTDLGGTWQIQYKDIPNLGDEYFNSIEFFDNSLIGFVSETSPRVLFTFDGGQHWAVVRDYVTNYGYSDPSKVGDTSWTNYKKARLIKSNNKMFFFGDGNNTLFKFNNLNVPKSAEEINKETIYCEYNVRSQAIAIDSKSFGSIENIALFDEAANKLYEKNAVHDTFAEIPRNNFGGAKVVFAVITVNKEVYIKKLICE